MKKLLLVLLGVICFTPLTDAQINSIRGQDISSISQVDGQDIADISQFEGQTIVSAVDWWDDWGRKVVITIQSSICDSGSENNVPILLNEDTVPAEMLDTNISGGIYNCQSDGGDLRLFIGDYSASNPATETTDRIPLEDTEITLGAGGGTLQFWTKADVSCSSNTPLTLYYNATGKSQPAIDDAYGAEAVWDSSYVAVWHLEDASVPLIDSTSNDNDISLANGSPSYQSTGKIGYGITLDDAAFEYFKLSNSPISNYPYTLSIWFESDDNTLVAARMFSLANDSSGNNKGQGLESRSNGIARFRRDTGTVSCNADARNSWTQDVFSHYAGIGGSNTSGIVILDGNEAQSEECTGDVPFNPGINSVGIGAFTDPTPDGYASGTVDEARISNTNRSINYMELIYRSTNSPGTYIIEGSPVTP